MTEWFKSNGGNGWAKWQDPDLEDSVRRSLDSWNPLEVASVIKRFISKLPTSRKWLPTVIWKADYYLTRRWGSIRSTKLKAQVGKNLSTESPLGQLSQCRQEGKGPQPFKTLFLQHCLSPVMQLPPRQLSACLRSSHKHITRGPVFPVPHPAKNKHKKQPGTQQKSLRISRLKEFKDLTDHNGLKIRWLNRHIPFCNVGVKYLPHFRCDGEPSTS